MTRWTANKVEERLEEAAIHSAPPAACQGERLFQRLAANPA